MTDKWFDEYMFRVVAEKKYVPAKVLDILKQKPIRLPAWDPMFADDEHALSVYIVYNLSGLYRKERLYSPFFYSKALCMSVIFTSLLQKET